MPAKYPSPDTLPQVPYRQGRSPANLNSQTLH